MSSAVTGIGSGIMLVVAWVENDKDLVLRERVSVDMGGAPVPDLTSTEMQAVAHAAKMELARQLRARARLRRNDSARGRR